MLNKNKHTIPPAQKKQNQVYSKQVCHFTLQFNIQDGNNKVLKQQKHISI